MVEFLSTPLVVKASQTIVAAWAQFALQFPRLLEGFKGPDVAFDAEFPDRQVLAVGGWPRGERGNSLKVMQGLGVAL